jgi:hypothetical protein
VLARTIERLAESGEEESPPYRFESMLDTFWHLAPGLLQGGAVDGEGWWFTAGAEGDGRVHLGSRTGWQMVWEPVLRGMLLGPATWLDLVLTDEDESGHLWIRPLARRGSTPAVDRAVTLGVNPRTVIPYAFLPAGLDEVSTHGALQSMAELAEITPDGFRYDLTRERVAAHFAAGATGPDVLHLLSQRTGVPVPDEVAAVLCGWSDGYGTIRIYDDLTLIELDDDILLQELQATSSLKASTLQILGPRLVAIDPARAQSLVLQMERLGYTPRIVDEA